MDLAVAASVVRQNPNALFFEVPLFLSTPEKKRANIGGAAAQHTGDDIRAAHPVGFVEIGAREVWRSIWMRMIEADDAEPTVACLALNVDKLFWSDPVACSSRLATGIRAANDLADEVMRAGDVTQQNSAALIGIGELSMSANRVEIVLREYQHRY